MSGRNPRAIKPSRKTLTVRATEAELKRWRKTAALDGRDLSNFVRHLLEGACHE